MCDEKRSTISSTDMSGKEPRRVWSINLNNMQFGLGLIIAFLSVLALIVGATSSAINWMHSSAEDHIQQDLRREVQPPAGVIYKATKAQIDAHKRESEARLVTMEKRQIRLNIMVTELYHKIIGTPPPQEIK